MIRGYARISNENQSFDDQLTALKGAGCEVIYEEVIQGVKKERPKLDALLDEIKEGDVLIIWKLDRLGRSMKELIRLINDLMEKGVGLKSLNDPIDTTTEHGRMVFNIFTSLAEFEKDIIRERTQVGLSKARARGRFGGRPKGLSQEAVTTAQTAQKLYEEGKMTIKQICEELNIARSTFIII